MSEDHDEHGDAIGINDIIDDEVSYYDAQNVNETQNENVNDADSETIKGNDNDNNETNQLVIINNNNETNQLVIMSIKTVLKVLVFFFEA